MRKYIASKPQRVFHLYPVILGVALLIYTIVGTIHVVRNNEGDFIIFTCMAISFGMSIVAGGGYAWKYLDDPILGKFSFDKDGITFYTPLRTIIFLYDECEEIGFTRWIAGGTITNHNYIYYIYFSKKVLTEEQRAYLFEGRSKKKRGKHNKPLYQSEYVLFQYRPDFFPDFIECVPERFRGRLVREEENIDFKSYEKFLNR